MRQRSCIACRKKQVSTALIPLRLDRRGSCFVDSKGKGRTLWLCRDTTCVRAILKQPERLRRHIRIEPPNPEIIRVELSKYFTRSAIEELVHAHESGLIVHGSRKVRACMQQNIAAIVFSDNVGSSTMAQISEIHNSVKTYIFPANSIELGKLIHRGPRSVLALQHSRKTQSLIHTLRVGCSLG